MRGAVPSAQSLPDLLQFHYSNRGFESMLNPAPVA